MPCTAMGTHTILYKQHFFINKIQFINFVKVVWLELKHFYPVPITEYTVNCILLMQFLRNYLYIFSILYDVHCTVYRSCGLFFKNFSARETILLVELNTLLLCSTLHGSFPPSEPIFSVKTWMFQTNSPKVFFYYHCRYLYLKKLVSILKLLTSNPLSIIYALP